MTPESISAIDAHSAKLTATLEDAENLKTVHLVIVAIPLGEDLRPKEFYTLNTFGGNRNNLMEVAHVLRHVALTAEETDDDQNDAAEADSAGDAVPAADQA